MDFVEEQIKEFDKKFVWFPSGGGEYWIHDGNPIAAKQFIRSFASTLIERVGSELIGEDDDIKILIAPMFKTMAKIRNQLRAEQRTKLHEMK